MSARRNWLVVSTLTLGLAACAGEEPVVEVAGECADAFGGQVCTWATTQGGHVLNAGATIPLSTVENAPGEMPMAWPPAAVANLALPEIAREQLGMGNMTFYWEPTGHPPAAYMVPHFDFHFYAISDAERMSIDCSDLTKPATLPAGYSLPDEALPPEVAAMIGVDTLVGICVPEMGMHSLLTTEIESATPFMGTMVVGYYGGQNIFVEPMITQSLLRERKSFDYAIPAIPGATGPRPVAFHAEYMADQDAYRFTFSGPPAADE